MPRLISFDKPIKLNYGQSKSDEFLRLENLNKKEIGYVMNLLKHLFHLPDEELSFTTAVGLISLITSQYI